MQSSMIESWRRLESDFPEDLTELSESEAESSYQELWQEHGVKYKQEESNDLKQLTGELTSDRDFFERRERRKLNSVRSVTVSSLS